MTYEKDHLKLSVQPHSQHIIIFQFLSAIRPFMVANLVTETKGSEKEICVDGEDSLNIVVPSASRTPISDLSSKTNFLKISVLIRTLYRYKILLNLIRV